MRYIPVSLLWRSGVFSSFAYSKSCISYHLFLRFYTNNSHKPLSIASPDATDREFSEDIHKIDLNSSQTSRGQSIENTPTCEKNSYDENRIVEKVWSRLVADKFNNTSSSFSSDVLSNGSLSGCFRESSQRHTVTIPSFVLRSVVKIFASSSSPNYLMPWQRKQQKLNTGSGFVIDEERRLLLTNAHVVMHAPFLELRKHGDSTKFIGYIVYVGVELDLAIIYVENDEFWELDSHNKSTLRHLPFVNCSFTESTRSNNASTNRFHSNYQLLSQSITKLHGIDIAESLSIDDSCDKDPEKEWTKSQPPLDPFFGIPTLQTSVHVLGYPMGGDQISVTSGVISRIDSTSYGDNLGLDLIVAQLDAAVNPGNSGGPGWCEHGVIGVAFQALLNADNIGYLIPYPLITTFIRSFIGKLIISLQKKLQFGVLPAENSNRVDISSQQYRVKLPTSFVFSPSLCLFDQGPRQLGILFQSIQNNHLRSHLGLKSHETGVVVRYCHPSGPSANILKVNDVLLELDGYPIADDATIEFRPRERISFNHLVTLNPEGRETNFRILRSTDYFEVTIFPSFIHRICPTHMFIDEFQKKPPFIVFGGLVFSILSRSLLDEWGSDWWNTAPRWLTNAYLSSTQADHILCRHIIIIAQVLPHLTTRAYQHLYVHIVTHANGIKLKSFYHLREILSILRQKSETTQEDTTLELITQMMPWQTTIASFSVKEAIAAEPILAEQYGIPFPTEAYSINSIPTQVFAYREN